MLRLQDMILAFPEIRLVNDDGTPVDAESYKKQMTKDDQQFEKLIQRDQRREKWSFGVVRVVEYLALVFTVAAMAQLVALAWLNF